jgi:hypothetical protein
MATKSYAEEAAQKELQQFLAVENQKARFQQQVHTFTDMCWDKVAIIFSFFVLQIYAFSAWTNAFNCLILYVFYTKY